LHCQSVASVRIGALDVFGALSNAESTICPCCGQPVLPEGLSLPPIKRRILDAVQRHPGITAEHLREIVWQADPNGGPEDRKVLHVHIHQLNQRLAPYGVMVRAPKGAGAGYRVRLLDARSRGPPSFKELPAEDRVHGGHKLSHSVQLEDFSHERPSLSSRRFRNAKSGD
jgi:hypothetical protein